MRLATTGLVLLLCFDNFGAPAVADTARLSPSRMAQMQEALSSAIRPCLMPPIGQTDTPSATIRLFFNRDGTLARKPELVASTNAAAGASLVRAATWCLARKGPVRFDANSYESWKVIQLQWTLDAL